VLFWNNLAGRFTHVDAPVQYQYANAHRNYPGKYLVELPLYLLPWTLPAVAALWRARKGATVPGPHRSAWRYALACCLPFLILLSLAATARDIYATPAMNGFALLLALWVLDRPEAGLARDRWALNCALVLALVLAAVATFFILLLAEGERLAGRPPWRLAFAAFAIAACATVAGVATRRAVRRDTLLPALRGVFLVYMSTMIIALAALAPVFDRWNDLPRVARRIADATHGRPLALLQPDETTIAMMDYRLATPFEHLRGDASASVSLARGWFERAGTDAVVLVKLPGRGPGEITGLLARLNVREPVQKQDMVDALVAARVAHIEQRFMIPHGRSFVLLAAGSGPAGGPTDSPAAVD
jgi:4-amino-4-deoxy-L-arabinose transferase-like glycosyltransferase